MTEEKKGIRREIGAQTGYAIVTPNDVGFFFHLLQEFLSWTIKAYGNKFLQPVVFGSSQFEEEGS